MMQYNGDNDFYFDFIKKKKKLLGFIFLLWTNTTESNVLEHLDNFFPPKNFIQTKSQLSNKQQLQFDNLVIIW